MTLSAQSKAELKWWTRHVDSAYNDACCNDPDVVVTSDPSLTGWGYLCEGVSSGGQWTSVEKSLQINYLELKAALFALQCFQAKLKNKHVRLMLDNTTAVPCVQHMGTSHSDSCHELTFASWSWCIENNIWVSAAHIPGKDNVIEDQVSRHINMDAEWKLNSTLLLEAFQSLHIFRDTDLFASRLNSQLEKYMYYRPDPAAVAVDAFSLSRRDITFYAFPPFSVVARVVQKVQQDEALGVLVVPD